MVRKEIEDETDRLTEKTKQISPVPIHLSIYSPNGKEFIFIFTFSFFGVICTVLFLFLETLSWFWDMGRKRFFFCCLEA